MRLAAALLPFFVLGSVGAHLVNSQFFTAVFHDLVSRQLISKIRNPFGKR